MIKSQFNDSESKDDLNIKRTCYLSNAPGLQKVDADDTQDVHTSSVFNHQ